MKNNAFFTYKSKIYDIIKVPRRWLNINPSMVNIGNLIRGGVES